MIKISQSLIEESFDRSSFISSAVSDDEAIRLAFQKTTFFAPR